MIDPPRPEHWATKDNEFVAWYPLQLTPEGAASVWQPRPAGYYVHIPYCTAICDYCGFSVERVKNADTGRYVRALHTEISRAADLGRLAGHEFVCGHFGGGTPSTLPPDQLVGVKKQLDSRALVRPGAEVTVEVNPISFTREHADVYAAGGINRISVGVQSFDDQILRLIGRPHRAGDVANVVEVIHAAQIENFSLDIIYGVPGQDIGQLRDDLKRAADTGATHLTCFRLEIIPYTALKLREAAGELPPRASQQLLNEMDDVITETLAGFGYGNYGAFNFAKPGFQSVHNDIAFGAPQGEYIGFGNSSYSYFNDCIYANHATVPRYIADVEAGRDPIALGSRATALERMSRYFVLGVKLRRVPRRGFTERFGLEPEQVFGAVLDDLTERGMLRLTDDTYVLTGLGTQYVNNVCKAFYVGGNRGRPQYAQFVSTLTRAQIGKYGKKAGAPVPPAGPPAAVPASVRSGQR
ncbi:MAG TPA: coproporphyrinogen-III oxidase family protein [Streptosporangiaceae bacterium]